MASLFAQRNSAVRLAINAMDKSLGYSFIELIIVVVLVGILGAVGFSRLIAGDVADPGIVSAQLISSIRSAQQRSVGRSDITITVQPRSDELFFVVEDGSGDAQRSQSVLGAISLSADVNTLDSCATTPGSDVLTTSSSMVLEFDSLGDLLRGGVDGSADYPEDITSGARICVNNDPRYSVCISKSGFAYAGDCYE